MIGSNIFEVKTAHAQSLLRLYRNQFVNTSGSKIELNFLSYFTYLTLSLVLGNIKLLIVSWSHLIVLLSRKTGAIDQYLLVDLALLRV